MIKLISDSIEIIKKAGVSRGQIFKVSFFSFLSFSMEIIGIGIFIPIIDLIRQPEPAIILNSFGINSISDEYDTYIICLIFILIIFSIKSFILIINSYYLVQFWSYINTKLTINIYKVILNKNYQDFIKKSNSSHLSLILAEVEQFSELIKFTVSFIVETIILFSIFIMLILYNSIASLIIFTILFIAFGAVYILFRERLIFWGKQRQIYQDDLQNNINAGLINYLSISINNSFKFFSSNVWRSITMRNTYIKRQFVYESIPKSFIEITSILILCISFYVLKYILEFNIEETLSFMAILLISFSRILPSVNRILTSYNFINFSKVVIDKIYHELNFQKNEFAEIEVDILDDKIKFSNVSFKYENSNQKILNNISFLINRNSITGVFGESGSGKSTLIKLLMGYLEPNNGEIFFDNTNYKQIKKKSLHKLFGYVEQNTRIFNSSLIQNITFKEYLSDSEKKWYRNILKICELGEFNSEKKFSLIEEGLNISGGQIQRIGLARALFKKPKILVLDEFSSALDNSNRNKLINILKQIKSNQGLTIIIISHDMYLKTLCDNVIDFETF